MEQLSIPLKGISTTSEYPDGDCLSVLNLRPKNGMLQPVTPRRVEKTNVRPNDKFYYVYMLVHKTADYENWIGIHQSGAYVFVYWDKLNGAAPTTIGSRLPGNFTSIHQIGNTLSVVTDQGVHYLVYKNGKYVFLGELPDLLPLHCAAEKEMREVQYYFVKEDYPAGTVTKHNLADALKASMNKQIEEMDNGNGYLFHDAFLVRYAYRLYDGSLTKHSSPLLVHYPLEWTKIYQLDYAVKNDEVTLDDGTFFVIRGSKLVLNYDFTKGMKNWEDIILSVDLFLSPVLGIVSTENMITDYQDIKETATVYPVKGITPSDVLKAGEMSVFYFGKSIPINTKGTNVLFPEKGGDEEAGMRNLVFQEQMADDDFSHHTLGALAAYTYNNRLHLANIRTVLFDGFHFLQFHWGNGAKANRVEYLDPMVEVYIRNGQLLERVCAYVPKNGSGQNSAYRLDFDGYFSYPDARAVKARIYGRKKDDGKVYMLKEMLLTPHKLLNLAYWINPNLNIINFDEAGTPIAAFPAKAEQAVIHESNKMKVSALNNPMSFPAIYTYEVGTGDILNLASNVMNVTDRNFGTYPLYVFTNRGIFMVQAGQEGVLYSSINPVSSNIVPVSPLISSTPYGIAFISRRGAYLINGNETTLLTPQLEQEPVSLGLPAGAADMVPSPFLKFLENLKTMVYNPHENELIFVHKEYDLNYVLNLEQQFVYLCDEKISSEVENSFPVLRVLSDAKIKDFSREGDPTARVSLLTRPLRLGTDEIKQTERFMLRGNFYKMQQPGTVPVLGCYAGLDGVNYSLIRGLKLTGAGKNRKDLDSGLLLRTTGRYFMTGMEAQMTGDSRIGQLEVRITKEYQNGKMR